MSENFRIALFSDIHCNAIALQAVLEDIRQRGADRLVCLGDVSALGPQPCETLDLLRASGADCILGNHDECVINPDCPPDSSEWVEEVTAWSRSQFSASDLDYLRGFHNTLHIPLGPNLDLLCCHGSPRANTEFISAKLSDQELGEMLAGVTSAVIACGHSHVPMLRMHEERMVLNVGSAGYSFRRLWQVGEKPRLHGWADYVILESDGTAVNVHFHRLPLDVPAIHQAAIDSSMPGLEEYLNMWR